MLNDLIKNQLHNKDLLLSHNEKKVNGRNMIYKTKSNPNLF
jgi:hypothetical protein